MPPAGVRLARARNLASGHIRGPTYGTPSFRARQITYHSRMLVMTVIRLPLHAEHFSKSAMLGMVISSGNRSV